MGTTTAPDRRDSGSVVARIERRQRRRNLLHGAVLLVALVALAGLAPWLLFGPFGALAFLGAAGVALALGPRIRTASVLAACGAWPLPGYLDRVLGPVVEELSDRAGLDRAPALYCLPVRTPEAFTVGGRRDAGIVVSTGLLGLLPPRGLVAVLGHEISHLRAADHTLMRVAGALTRMAATASVLGAVVLVADLGAAARSTAAFLLLAVVLLLVPVAVTLLDLGFARSRELDADLGAANLTGDPEALATALEQVDLVCGGGWWLLAPRPRRTGGTSLLSSHPATEDRARRLRQLEPGRRT